MSPSKKPLDAYRRRAELALETLIAGEVIGRADERLAQAMRYSLLAGGKRLRPVLIYAASDALGGARADALDCDRAACAIECLHTYSLIHDDLPAMDDDDLRRGIPTCHKAFGEASAILAGDALHTLAFELLCDASSVAPAMRLQLIETLAVASGSRGMVGGQAIDLAHVGRAIEINALETMHGLKTGALIRAAVRIGALLAGADEESQARLDRFARHLGLAFQVQDDILDLCGDAQALGKQPGSDAALAKPTYATLLGADGARRLSIELRDAAQQELAPLGSRAAALGELAHFVVNRDR
ncbi:MAG: polyprenyl synthetase family protein [Gammaproteobacteria bacterium]|nr:polyprenyl synthetase family protein [Gammaproteobacteria bacterium]